LSYCRGEVEESEFSNDSENAIEVSEGTLFGNNRSKLINSPRRIRSRTLDEIAGIIGC